MRKVLTLLSDEQQGKKKQVSWTGKYWEINYCHASMTTGPGQEPIPVIKRTNVQRRRETGLKSGNIPEGKHYQVTPS